MRRATLTACLALLACLAVPSAAPAAVPFDLEELEISFTDKEGNTVTQAGSHPYEMTTSIRLFSEPNGEGGEITAEAVKDILIDQVEGFVGNPTAVPRCSNLDFLTPLPENVFTPNCPDGSAVGTLDALTSPKGGKVHLHGALYNLTPPPGVAAKLGAWLTQVPVTIELGVRETPPYNVTGGLTNASQLLEVLGSELVIWGNPADPDHDPLRGHCLDIVSGESTGEECPANIPPVPFLTLPRACNGPLSASYAVSSWQNPDTYIEGSTELPEITGCGKLLFGPELTIVPSTDAAESPTGLQIGIDVDDEGIKSVAKTAAAAPDIEATAFALPAGMTLNPSAAEGLGVCTLAQFQAASLADPACPPSAKLGSLEVDTPIIENHTFRGAFYLAAQEDNPFGSMFAAYLMISDPELGVFVKLAAEIETDPETGQIITAVKDMPQIPLERVRVNLKSGPRAPLITPPTCGTYATEALLYPSNGAGALEPTPTFQITQGPGGGPCPPGGVPPFSPGFDAGSVNSAAGHYSPFGMRITRQDGQQDLTRLAAVLPPGVSGKIAGIPACPDASIAAAKQKTGRAELASPSCSAASKIGSVLTGAGVGSALTYVPGSLYLAGPYNGAPLSVAAIVPAVAGPFDVGTVVVRTALDLNPDTAQVEVDGAASDPIPHILKGVPLKLRDLQVLTDRPNFTLNPTSCAESQTTATLFGSGANPFSGADDSAIGVTERFQAASCASLGFKPRLILRLKGATRRAKNPAFRAELKARGGDANVKGAILTLPPSQFIDNAHISNPCTRPQFAEGRCPKRSILGRARAFTPLLDYPLEGPVYFRSNGGARLLPDVVADLGGGPGQFRFTLVIAILRSKNARVRTKVLNAPDAPVTKFVLNMAGGKRGLLENSEHLCARPQRAYLNLIGQNGRRYKTKPKVKTPSCHKKGKRKGRRGGAYLSAASR